MSKLVFKAEDFFHDGTSMITFCPEQDAQAIHDQWLGEQRVVYSDDDHINSDYPCTVWATMSTESMTHKAYLVDVQEIKTECEHHKNDIVVGGLDEEGALTFRCKCGVVRVTGWEVA